jgi:allantoinase
VIWDPDKDFEVTANGLYHRHPLTPYAGRRLRGVVETTLVRGRVVFDRGTFADAPLGEPLRRDHA